MEQDKNLQEQIIELQNQLEELNKIKIENEELRETNKLLFTKNQQYFLQITSDKNTTPTQEEEKDTEYKNYVGEDFYNTLSTKEKELLKEILEGED